MLTEESPLLGQASGVYREKAVLPILRRHFLSVWQHQKPLGPARQTAVVPDASADLIWFGGTLLVTGPDRKVSFKSVPAGTTVVGVRFQPGAVASLLGVPASEIVGARLPLDSFWRDKGRALIDAIGDAQEPHLVATRLEAVLASMARDLESPDAGPKIILECLAHPRDDIRLTTRELTSALGTSERTLRRHCERAFGYGPKTLARVIRIQRFLQLARMQPVIGLANLAAAAGYADQAHLSREARRLTGLTPQAILNQVSA